MSVGLINSVGAHWEGNRCGSFWRAVHYSRLPRVYAAAFSGFYVAMILVLCALFFRPLAFDYRGKIANALARLCGTPGWLLAVWSLLLSSASRSATCFGRAFYLHSTASCAILGTFWQLLSPFALLCGALSLMLVILQGGV